MKAVYKKINFDVTQVMKEELPMTQYFYSEREDLAFDLAQYLEFPTNNQNEMPFYSLKASSADKIARTYQSVYNMLIEAVAKLFKEDDEVIKYFFGKEFLEKHPDFLKYAKYTFKEKHPALYGRFDSALNPETDEVTGIYEFNGDTPVMLFESVLLQNRFTNEVTGSGDAQFNEYYLDLSEFAARMKVKQGFAVICDTNYIEDTATCETFAQIFNEVGHCFFEDVAHLDYDHYEARHNGGSPFFIGDDAISDIFLLKPWEEMVEEHPELFKKWEEWKDVVKFYEPAWRWFMANKGIWAYVTHLFENNNEEHEDFRFKYKGLPILPSYMTPEKFINNGEKYVAKPIIGRLSMNIRIIDPNEGVEFESDGGYEETVCIYQQYHAPYKVEGRNNFIACCWMAPEVNENYRTNSLNSLATTFCIREFDKPVLDIMNERFIPHLIDFDE